MIKFADNLGQKYALLSPPNLQDMTSPNEVTPSHPALDTPHHGHSPSPHGGHPLYDWSRQGNDYGDKALRMAVIDNNVLACRGLQGLLQRLIPIGTIDTFESYEALHRESAQSVCALLRVGTHLF